MKETKVYVDELPESCSKCLFCYDNRPYWKSTDCILLRKELDEDEIETSVNENCPLQSIKDHDRELVKEVCEKIRKFCENNKYRCNKYFLLYSIGLNVKLLNKNKEGQKETFYEFLDQLQKEYEK